MQFFTKDYFNAVQDQKLRLTRHILESLVGDTIEGMMMGKATRGRKQVQTLSDVISKTYKDLKREAENRRRLQKRLS